MPLTHEQQARERTDHQLKAAVWILQDVVTLNLAVGRGIAIREFPLSSGHGTADNLLYVDRKAPGKDDRRCLARLIHQLLKPIHLLPMPTPAGCS